MADQRVAGLIRLQVNGEVQKAKGNFSYCLGGVKRETIIGSDGVHGYKETPIVAYIEGMITDRGDLNLRDLTRGKDLTVNLKLGNDKMISLENGFYAGDGKASTDEGEIEVRWEGSSAAEVRA